jgi:Flp pilus assembly protein TadD
VSLLLQLGVDVNAVNAKGVSPLILSCMLNQAEMVKMLLAANAELRTAALPGGITALHIAAEAGFLEVAQVLVSTRPEDAKVLANQRLEGGLATPLQLAAGKQNAELVALLQPLTEGYEDHHVDALMATEKAKIDQYLVEAAKHVPVEASEETEAERETKAILEGVVPDELVEVPVLAAPLDEAAVAQVTAWKEEGNKAFVAKAFQDAVNWYTKALALNPAEAVLYSNRCAAYLGLDQPKAALNDIRVAKKLKPDWVKAHFREGQCLEALGLYEDAAVALWAAIQLQPKDTALEKRFQAVVAKGRAKHQSSSSTTPSSA